MIDLKNRRVLVVGDVILDTYVYGRKLGVSAETPTVVAEYDRTETFVGGAGLVARHLLRLGAEVSLLTVGGERMIIELMEGSTDRPTDEEMLRFQPYTMHSDGWSFTEKRRYFVDGYKMVQYDVLNRGDYNRDLNLLRRVQSYLDELQSSHDVVVVCDNRHGVMSLLRVKMAGKVFVDSQVSQYGSNHMNYVGASVVFMNERELDSLIGWPSESVASRLEDAVSNLRSTVVLKRGDLGSLAMMLTGELIETPASKVDVVDTCGAGDAFLAAYAVTEDLVFANRWAALSCAYSGTVVPKESP